MTKEIPLTNGGVALVDAEDFERVSQYTWSNTGGYAKSNMRLPSGNKERMHRFILGITDAAIEVDHINHDTLDNRRSNLRQATRQQNTMHRRKYDGKSTPYKGVSLNQRLGKYLVFITVNGVQHYLGCHEDLVTAARCYDAHAIQHFGPFALLNFPDGEHLTVEEANAMTRRRAKRGA